MGPLSLPQFSWRDRFRLTWELTWPLALIDLAVVLVIHGLIDDPGETLDSIWAVASFFVVSPWVIRRALARDYRGQTIAVMNGDTVRSRLTYQESLKVMWLLAWRSLALGLAALLLVSGILRLFGITSRDLPALGPLGNALGLSAIDTVTSLAFFPLLIPGMIRKRYRNFHLELRQAVKRTETNSPIPVKVKKRRNS